IKCSFNEYKNIQIVENLLQANRRGRPHKRLKSAVEETLRIHKKAKISNENYKYQNCDQDGHNSRRCTAPCKICQESGHIYRYCSNKENM
ncbi:5409_t:CDS:1, partial [Gigaspora margarita]